MTKDDHKSGLLLRDGDIIIPSDGVLFLYRTSDGAALKASFEKWRTLVSGKVVSISLEDGSDGWEWLQTVSIEDLASVRLIRLPKEVDAGHLETLKRLAGVNPSLGLLIPTESVLLQLLPLFKPRVLQLDMGVIGAGGREVLANQKQLETLIVTADEPGSLDFLAGLPNLRRLAISGWDPEKVGPIPEGLWGLRSLLVLQSNIKDVASLANIPRSLEELSLVFCENLSDIHGLAAFADLRTLILNLSPAVRGLSELGKLSRLRWMGMPPNISEDEFASVLKAHPNLEFLEMVGCDNVKDLSPLGGMKSLEGLILNGPYSDLTVLHAVKSLRFVGIYESTFTDSPDRIAALQAALPDAMITPVAPMCLGSGWILVLFPVAILLWLLRARLPRRKAAAGP